MGKLSPKVKRIIKFQVVAVGGTIVNMTTLFILKGQARFPLIVSGAIAIELAIIHNFTWHYFKTWKERVHHTVKDYFKRLFQYNIVTASIDFTVNLSFLWFLTNVVGLHYMLSNLFGMMAGPILKYFANDLLIFNRKKTDNPVPENSEIRGKT
ncbi:hypothetical protein DRQ07_10790 [candidate division KSB1 bacterium]|nr:MAG: hypothetical protein DRQ07_10790 [candidate division KSB1 bacterium]